MNVVDLRANCLCLQDGSSAPELVTTASASSPVADPERPDQPSAGQWEAPHLFTLQGTVSDLDFDTISCDPFPTQNQGSPVFPDTCILWPLPCLQPFYYPLRKQLYLELVIILKPHGTSQSQRNLFMTTFLGAIPRDSKAVLERRQSPLTSTRKRRTTPSGTILVLQ